MAKTLVEEYVDDPEHMRLFESVMKETGVTRSELAERLGKTKGWVTQLLDGEANKTIRTVADALAVLGRECDVRAPRISIGGKAAPVKLERQQATAPVTDSTPARAADSSPAKKNGEPRRKKA